MIKLISQLTITDVATLIGTTSGLLLVLHKIGFYQLTGSLSIWLAKTLKIAFQKLKKRYLHVEAYLKPNARQRQPLKNTDKTLGWASILFNVMVVAMLAIYSLLMLLLMFMRLDSPYVLLVGGSILMFFAIAARYYVADAHRQAWRNGINIQLRKLSY